MKYRKLEARKSANVEEPKRKKILYVVHCQDEETLAGSEEQLRQINCQLGLDVASKLGFMNAKDLISNEDLDNKVGFINSPSISFTTLGI